MKLLTAILLCFACAIQAQEPTRGNYTIYFGGHKDVYLKMTDSTTCDTCEVNPMKATMFILSDSASCIRRLAYEFMKLSERRSALIDHYLIKIDGIRREHEMAMQNCTTANGYLLNMEKKLTRENDSLRRQLQLLTKTTK